MSIGKNIQTLRKDNNMSQDQLAQKCNVSRQTISRWECDEVLPDTNNLITISKLFNKSLDEIVFEKEIVTNEEITIVEQPNETKKKKNNWVLIGIISLIINAVLSVFILTMPENEKVKTLDGTYETYVEAVDEKMVLVIETDNTGNSYGELYIGHYVIMSNCLLKEIENSNSEYPNIKSYELKNDYIKYKMEYYPVNDKIIITGISSIMQYEPFASEFEFTRI